MRKPIALFSFFLLLCFPLSADLLLERVSHDEYEISFTDEPNVAAYQATIKGGKPYSAEYLGTGDKSVEFYAPSRKMIIYGMNGNMVGDGKVRMKIKSYGRATVELVDVVAATPEATVYDCVKQGSYQIENTVIKAR